MSADGLRRAISTQPSKTALAAKLGITLPAITQWRQVPATRVLEVERITGVSRHELRPDIFGPAPCASSSLPAVASSVC
ncbi:Cro/CI family transcriptional regulator [Methylorubrum zatmanii]